MSEVTGKLMTCDRCGKQIFLKTIGDEETDGGFTRWNKFEDTPDGWNLVAVPKVDGTRYICVCPVCHALWDEVINEYFLKGTEYYMKEETV